MLPDKDKTKEQLVSELALLRQRVAELEKEEAKRKQAEQALRESEENYRRLFELCPIGIATVDMKGVITACNPVVFREGGYSEDELVGKHFSNIAPIRVRDIPKYMRMFSSIIRGEVPKPFEVAYTHKDGASGWTEIHLALLKAGGKKLGVQVLQRDITERKQAEEAVRESEERIHTIVSNAPVVIWALDKEGIFTLSEGAGLKALGLRPGEVVGQSIFDMYRDLPKILEDNRRALSGKTIVSTVEARGLLYESHYSPIRDKNRKVIGMVGVSTDITERKQAEEGLQLERDKLTNILDSMRDEVYIINSSCELEYVNPTLEAQFGPPKGRKCYAYFEDRQDVCPWCCSQEVFAGKTIRWEWNSVKTQKTYDIISTPLQNADGSISKLSMFRDLTDRKQAEEREKELQQELSVSMRLAAAGELAAGVAHEINNPLTGILGFSERLLRKSTDEEIRRDLERIHNEAQRIIKVMNNLRTFTHHREPEKQYSDINDILQMTLELRAYELKTGNIEVVTDFAPSLPEIEVDSNQIQEVFLNIILNAEQAMTEAHGGDKLTIKTGKIKDYVRISFTDDGPGISAEHLDRLFDPFFTTRGEQGGTGLGLSVCHGIVTEHGGRLYAKSKPGKGATFLVELPTTAKKVGKA